MNSTNFKYWLQGYFEIGGTSLYRNQIQVIEDHMKIVQGPDQFIGWLGGYFDATRHQESLSPTECTPIKEKLQGEFNKVTPTVQEFDWETIKREIQKEPPVVPYIDRPGDWSPNPYRVTCEGDCGTTHGDVGVPRSYCCSDQGIQLTDIHGIIAGDLPEGSC